MIASSTELEFVRELVNLLKKFEVKLEQRVDTNQPECGFIINYMTMQFKGKDINISLIDLQHYQQKFLL